MGKWYFSIMPMILVSVATYLLGRDSNRTGTDDAVGSVLLASAPAVQGLVEGNQITVWKALKAIRDGIDAALAQQEAQAALGGQGATEKV